MRNRGLAVVGVGESGLTDDVGRAVADYRLVVGLRGAAVPGKGPAVAAPRQGHGQIKAVRVYQ
ncbi:hypothetical protein D3C85_1875650 [compost metagenome]